jgi:hypothetical protein
MPPINQQGSRAGLITALVVFAILFITSSIFAFQYYGQLQKTIVDADSYKKRYNGIVLDNALASAPIEALRTAAKEKPNKFNVTDNDTAMQVSLNQTSTLASIIRGNAAGTDNPAGPAVDEATKTISDCQAQLKTAGLPQTLSSGLDEDVKELTAALISANSRILSLQGDIKAADVAAAAAKSASDTALAEKDAAFKKKSDDDAVALAAKEKELADKQATYDNTQKDITTAGATVQAATAQKDAQIQDQLHQIDGLKKKIDSLEARFANRRPSVEDAVLRQSDGKIVRVATNNVCYINLGRHDQVTPGLTFEVYDKAEGVPGLPANGSADEQMPVGKGSIEITHVGETSSECRVIKTTPGAILAEGDLIANLVYDPHTKYNFFVYGDFDLSETGRPNAPDAEVIKRLITQWGGKIGDTVGPATDFVVLGAEPVVPTFAKDDITAENSKKVQDAQDKLAKYQEVESAAKELHIPILNQNRFLYYVGFYDQAKR